MTVFAGRDLGRAVRAPLVVVFAIGVLLASLATPVHAQEKQSGGKKCQDVYVPVTVPGISDAKIFGELCTPDGKQPTTVHLLVPGSTGTHTYWDREYQPGLYSYVDRAMDDGFATLSIDRIGSGKSTRPVSTDVTLELEADTLSEVITQLRSGLGGHTFTNVVYVGHSLGSIIGWVEASRHQDVDAFVLTAMTHEVKQSFLPTVSGTYYPASEDPKFADSGFDSGYMTTKPGTRPIQFFYEPGSDPKVIEQDEQGKDTVSGTEFGQAVGLISSPPADTAPSRQIRVPTLLVAADKDPFFCGSPDGISCTKQTILEHESPYYSAEAQLDVVVAPKSGHSIQLHYSAASTTERVLSWLDDAI